LEINMPRPTGVTVDVDGIEFTAHAVKEDPGFDASECSLPSSPQWVIDSIDPDPEDVDVEYSRVLEAVIGELHG
jgi:23S rRNA A2030 N6-methylase RlmJ